MHRQDNFILVNDRMDQKEVMVRFFSIECTRYYVQIFHLARSSMSHFQTFNTDEGQDDEFYEELEDEDHFYDEVGYFYSKYLVADLRCFRLEKY